MRPGRGAPRRGRFCGVVWLLILCSGLAACVEPPAEPLEDPAADAILELETPELAAASLERRAQQITVRIRSLGCEQLGLGSGFVLPGGVVVTNRHVLVQPLQVTVNTWDGISLAADVSGVAIDSDLAILQLESSAGLEVAELRSEPIDAGERIHAIGYPDGGPVTVSSGTVLGTVDGSLLGEPADVIRIDATIRQGNSGGPLLDDDGRVVGVVFALETERGTGLAVPVTTLLERIDSAELEVPAGC
jgi:S1-C subfamily serine protease